MTPLSLIRRICAAALLASASAGAATYYVNNKIGSDAFNGLSPQPGPGGSGPFATIRMATSLLGAGDKMVLANTGVPYRESIHFHGVRGAASAPIVVDGGGAVITGLRRLTRWIKQKDGAYLCPLRGRPYGFPFVVVNGRRQPTALRKGAAKAGQCVWDAAGVWFRPEPGKTPDDYRIEATVLISGVQASSSSYIVVRNLVSEYHSNDGYNIHGECRGWRLEHVVGRRNGDDGFSIHETIGAVVCDGHFYENSFGVQDVNASRTILNGVTVERNQVGFSLLGGFRSLVDCVARDNKNAAITLYANQPKHLLGSASNPMTEITAYLKNVYAIGGANALEMRGPARAMAEHCVFGYADVGVRLDAASRLHLTASIVAHCKRFEILSRSPRFYRDCNIYFPGRFYWLTQSYGPDQFDAFRQAAGGDEHSLIADPKLTKGSPYPAVDSPARKPIEVKNGRYRVRVVPGFAADSPTPGADVVAGWEAEAAPGRQGAVVEDANASAGKAVDLSAAGDAVWGEADITRAGSYAVLALACARDYGRCFLTVSLAGQTRRIALMPFSYYAPRCVFRVAKPGRYAWRVARSRGRARVDRVCLARVRGAK